MPPKFAASNAVASPSLPSQEGRSFSNGQKKPQANPNRPAYDQYLPRNIYKRKLKIEKEVWVRIVPTLEGTKVPWMWLFGVWNIPFLNDPTSSTKIAHAASWNSSLRFDPENSSRNEPDAFDLIKSNLYTHSSGKDEAGQDIHPYRHLINKKNAPGPLRFAQQVGAAWVILPDAPLGDRLRLLVSGAKKGAAGAVLEAIKRKNRDGSLVVPDGDVAGVEKGRLVGISCEGKGLEAVYTVTIDGENTPIEDMMTLLTDEEQELLKPLETVIHKPTEEDIYRTCMECLGAEVTHHLIDSRLVRGQS